MLKDKRKAIEKAGFRVGDAADFLELTPEERSIVELRLAVAAQFAADASTGNSPGNHLLRDKMRVDLG